MKDSESFLRSCDKLRGGACIPWIRRWLNGTSCFFGNNRKCDREPSELTKTYDQLVKEYKIAVKDLEQLELDVDKAAKKLQKIRAKDPSIKDGEIGLHAKNSKSFAKTATIPSLAVLLAAVVGWTLN